MIAVAGIARPERFFGALRAQGLDVARELVFRDHHWYTPRDVARIEAAAREAQADLVVTTEKDAVRLEALLTTAGGPAWAVLPMTAAMAPACAAWLRERL